MVIYCGWHRTAMDPNSRSSCLPITGEDTGLEALASPLAGYLGKVSRALVQGRAASLDYCPWCTSKGLSYALRSYRISLQDSITVCTNPQCLFPLVSRSLEDVLASLDAVEPVVGNKRKNASTQEKEELIKPSFKRLRSSELGEPQGVTAKPVSPAEDGAVNNTEGVKSESEDLSGSPLKESEDLVPIPDQLLWRNSDNLCWLDSLLAALFNCKSLQRCKPKDEPQQSSLVRTLTCFYFSGQRETPVFAMPLLLVMDSWVECLFQATFYWEMKCSKCKTPVRKRDMKTLPTLTNILPDWHPLKAAHLGTCNVCCKKNEMRTMVLESLPPVFALHFVEGLPNNDVSTYTFNFKGKNYSVTTVIQYKSYLKHFVTWTCRADGSWLEYDDLKYPDCKTHQKLQVPANEMHIVFWEVEDDKELHIYTSSNIYPTKI
uniref:SUMO-specific isopeptidase USPL1-like n=1 Tax=Neolamprologus brichardi TaxID=32507 RepID=A0A3Q4H6Q3_NEOBR